MAEPPHVGLTTFPRPATPYEAYMTEEGLPIHRGVTGFSDVRTLEVGDWKRVGAAGAFIELEGIGNVQGTYLLKVAAGSSTEPEKHLFEEVFYVVEGRGYDLHWDVGFEVDVEFEWSWADEPKTFEWKKGDFVFIPAYTVKQHVNADPDNEAAEFSVVVRSDTKRQGLASRMLRKLVDYCRNRGTLRLEGEVLAENNAMLELVKRFGGFTLSDTVEEGTVKVVLRLP